MSVSQFANIKKIDSEVDANDNMIRFRSDVVRELTEIRTIVNNPNLLATRELANIVTKTLVGTGLTMTSTRLDKLGASNGKGDVTLSVTPYTYAPYTHKLLSSTHDDTTSGTPVRGDIITAQGTSPVWARLAKGTLNQALLMGAEESAWTTLTPSLVGAMAVPSLTENYIPKALADGITIGNSIIKQHASSSYIGIGRSPTTYAMEVAGDTYSTGSIRSDVGLVLKEGSAPSFTSGYAKLYVSSTSPYNPYWMRRDGVTLFAWGATSMATNSLYGPGSGNATASGNYNSTWGTSAGAGLTSGGYSTLFGYCAGFGVTDASYVTAIGANCCRYGTGGAAGTYVGRGAAQSACASSTVVGNSAHGGLWGSKSITAVSDNGSGKCRFTTSTYHFLESGYYVFILNSTVAAYNGYYAVTIVNATTFDCTALAYTTTATATIYYAMSGNYNSAFGYAAGGAVKPTSTEYLFIGHNTGYQARTSYSTLIAPYEAGPYLSGNCNVGIGHYTFGGRVMPQTTNIASCADNGSGKCRFTYTGSYNFMYEGAYVQLSTTTYYDGYYAISNVTNTTFDVTALTYVDTCTGTAKTCCTSAYSVAVGNDALSYGYKDDNSVCIGYSSGQYALTGSSKTYIGYAAGRYNIGAYSTYVGASAGGGGSSITVSAVADNGSGKVRVTATAAHYLHDTQQILWHNNSNYSGYWTITWVSPTVFDITALSYTSAGGTGTIYPLLNQSAITSSGYDSAYNHSYSTTGNVAVGYFAMYWARGGGYNLGIGTSTAPFIAANRNVTIGALSQGAYYAYANGNVTISAVANNGSGQPRFTHSTNSFTDQQYVYIVSTIYGGYYQITVIDTTHFDVTSLAYSSTSTGTVFSVITGNNNVNIGSYGQYVISTGTSNTSVGAYSSYALKSGAYNLHEGYKSGYTTSTASRQVFLGAYSGYYETASDTLMIDCSTAGRTNEATARYQSLVYGLFNAAPASQLLSCNGILQAQIYGSATNTVQNVLRLRHNSSGTPAAGYGLSILSQLQSSTTVDQDASAIITTWIDPTHGATYSKLSLQNVAAGTLTERLSFAQTEAVFNDGGANYDLRVEGDTDANLFVADASADMIGIGTNGPTAKVDINSDIIRLRTAKTPATAGAAGNAGDICWDADYVYVCVAASTWKRAAIATW